MGKVLPHILTLQATACVLQVPAVQSCSWSGVSFLLSNITETKIIPLVPALRSHKLGENLETFCCLKGQHKLPAQGGPSVPVPSLA